MSESAQVTSEENLPLSFELLLITQSTSITQRVKTVCDNFGYQFKIAPKPDDVAEKFENAKIKFIVLDSSTAENQNDVVGQLQGIKYFFPELPILVIFPKRFDKNTLPWIRKSGANYVMSEGDFLELPRFDFFVNQLIGSEYLAVKHGDFEKGTSIEIPLYYFMPVNEKFLPIIPAGTILDESRLDKVRKIGEVYIRRADVDAYNQYMQANQSKSAEGLARRCRLQFNEFRSAYLNFINHITEEAENPSYEEGKKLLDLTLKMSRELITMMMSASSVFEIINQSVEGEYNSVDRAPERAAIVGFITVMASIGDTERAMLAALLADVGLLNLPVDHLNHFRVAGYTNLPEPIKKLYEQHPQFSINVVAQKKINLEPPIRDAILYSHSKQDETGFPIVRPGRIGVEAQLIHFVQLLDDHCRVQWGTPRLNYKEEFKKMVYEPKIQAILSQDVLTALRGIA